MSSLQDRKKDIIAEAMREEKIYEEINRTAAAAAAAVEAAKKSASHTPPVSTPSAPSTSASTSSAPVPAVIIKQEPSTSKQPEEGTSESEPKPGTSAGTSAGTSSSTVGNPHASASARGKSPGRPPQRLQQQQMMPRLQLLDEEDDGLTCRMCLQPFWFKSELKDHLKSTHSITGLFNTSNDINSHQYDSVSALKCRIQQNRLK